MNGKDTRNILEVGKMLATQSTKQKQDASGKSTRQSQVGTDLAALGKRWTFHILRNIGVNGVDRFNKMLRSVPGLTPRVLIMRLNELEQRNLIRPIVIREKPRLVRWELTEKGKDTLPIFEGYTSFVTKWYPGSTLRNHRNEPAKRRAF
jgi:DNA-binding HxlR family transcriptional regulator